MHEHSETRPESIESIEEKVTYLMDTRGISRVDAEYLLAMRETPDRQVAREGSRSQHPSNSTRRPYVRRGRPAVGEDSQDVMTGILSDEQVAINARGIALARAVLRTNTPELTAQERAVRRAREEKRNIR